MNRRRQLAYYTVVNIDGNRSSELSREGDRWFFDSRIAESEQIGEALYRRNALDRGHLVRRLDPVWGPQASGADGEPSTSRTVLPSMSASIRDKIGGRG